MNIAALRTSALGQTGSSSNIEPEDTAVGDVASTTAGDPSCALRRDRGPQLHHCRPYLLRLRHQGEHRLEGDARWRQYESIFPALRESGIDQVSIECCNSRVPMRLLELLDGKEVLIGVIDVATDVVETPEEVAAVIAQAMKYVSKEKIIACTNCGMAPMNWDTAFAKLAVLGRGAELARQKFG